MTGGVARIRFFARFIIVLLHDFVGRRLWRYRWEGAMNIVVAYCGPDAQLQGSVLRLRKRSADFSADDFAPPPMEESFAFLCEMVEPRIACFGCRACGGDGTGGHAAGASLCSSELLVRGALVEVAEPFLCELSRMCAPHRPAARTHRDLETASRRGWLLPDLSYIPHSLLEGCGTNSPARRPLALSVEIKPKSCVLPRLALVKPQHAIKSRVSRFRMMQTTKLKTGKVPCASNYDPMDLFSSQEERVEKALADLLDQPQNNLYLRAYRVHEARARRALPGQAEAAECEDLGEGTQVALAADDGSIAENDNAHNTSCFTLSGDRKSERNHLLEEIFDVHRSASEGAGICNEGRDDMGLEAQAGGQMAAGETAFCRFVARALIDCGVLTVVEHLQHLDAWDIENIARIHEYLKKNDRGEAVEESECRAQAPGGVELPAVGLWRQCCDDFLVAQSAKDCSLLLTLVLLPDGDASHAGSLPRGFRRARVGVTGCDAGARLGGASSAKEPEGGFHVAVEQGAECRRGRERVFLYRCGLMDLDIKPARKIPEYLQQDAEIVAAYLEQVQHPSLQK
jgi:hypothetical protein